MVTQEQKDEILKLAAEGVPQSKIAEETGVPLSSVKYTVKKNKEPIEEKKMSPITAAKVFKQLEEGVTLPQIVIDLKADPDAVQQLYDKWLSLKETDVNQASLETINTLLEEAKKAGKFKREHCHFFDEQCWVLKGQSDYDPKTYKDPSNLQCALCPSYLREEEDLITIITEED